MEEKKLSLESKTEFQTILKQAEFDPDKFFDQIKNKYDKNELTLLLRSILCESSDIKLLKNTIQEIATLKFEENLDDLIDFLMSKKFDERVDKNEIINLKTFCIKAISFYKDKKCIPVLLYCLNDKSANYKMRFQAAEALGKIGDKIAVESLINVVSDEDEKSVYVRESAAVALGMIGDMRAIDPFLTILEAKKNFLDKFTFLKERVMEAITKINFQSSKRVITAFKNALNDDSPRVRINAIECLMNSEDENAYEFIKEKLKDTDEEVIKNAVIALYNLKGKEALFEILKDESLPVAAKDEADEIYREYEDERQETDE